MANLKTKSNEAKSSQEEVNPDQSVNASTQEVSLSIQPEHYIAAQHDPMVVFSKTVLPKYEGKKYIALVSREDAVRAYLGWEMLKWDTRINDVIVVKSADEAYKTTGNVLCWCDWRIHKVRQDQLRKRNDVSNTFITQEDSRVQAQNLAGQLEGMSNGKVTAKALAVRESDD